MDKKDFIQQVNNSESLGDHSLKEYISLIREYPFFQSAHILLLKALKEKDSPNFQHQLEETAIFISNRKKLFDYLSENHRHSDPYTYELKEEKEPEQKEETPSLRGKEIVSPEDDQVEKKSENSRQDDEEKDNPEDEEGGEKQRNILNESKGESREEESIPKEINSEDYHEAINKRRNTDTLQESIEQALLSQIEDANTDWDNVEFKGTAVVDIIHPGQDDPELSFKIIQDNSTRKLESTEPEKVNHEKAQPADKENSKDFEGSRMLDEEEDQDQVLELELDQPQLIPEYFKPYLKENPEDEGENVSRNEVVCQQKDLIENFINSNPRIETPAEPPKEIEDISKKSVIPREALLTETLANIYIRQGYYSKAIFAYEKLSLKYPEKSIYFAEQMKKVKELINK